MMLFDGNELFFKRKALFLSKETRRKKGKEKPWCENKINGKVKRVTVLN
jgi:hypothetical protein